MGYDPRYPDAGHESSTEWHFVENWSRTEVFHIPLEHFPSVVSEICQCLLGESPGLGLWAASSNQADIDSKREGQQKSMFLFPLEGGVSWACQPARAAMYTRSCSWISGPVCIPESSCASDIKPVFSDSVRSDWATSTLGKGLPWAMMWREESPGKPNCCDLIP